MLRVNRRTLRHRTQGRAACSLRSRLFEGLKPRASTRAASPRESGVSYIVRSSEWRLLLPVPIFKERFALAGRADDICRHTTLAHCAARISCTRVQFWHGSPNPSRIARSAASMTRNRTEERFFAQNDAR